MCGDFAVKSNQAVFTKYHVSKRQSLPVGVQTLQPSESLGNEGKRSHCVVPLHTWQAIPLKPDV